jgi:hypothetical protein
MLAESPRATLYTRGFSSFITSTAAPIATGDQFPGRTFPLWTSAFHGARKYLNNVVEQDHRTVKKHVAGERVRLILNRLADIARNRSREYDSEGQSERGGEGGCNRAGHFHCRAVWHYRVTPKSIEQPQSPSAHVQTEFRNETLIFVIRHGQVPPYATGMPARA